MNSSVFGKVKSEGLLKYLARVCTLKSNVFKLHHHQIACLGYLGFGIFLLEDFVSPACLGGSAMKHKDKLRLISTLSKRQLKIFIQFADDGFFEKGHAFLENAKWRKTDPKRWEVKDLVSIEKVLEKLTSIRGNYDFQ